MPENGKNVNETFSIHCPNKYSKTVLSGGKLQFVAS